MSNMQRLLGPDAASLLSKAMTPQRKMPCVAPYAQRGNILTFFKIVFDFSLLVCLRQDVLNMVRAGLQLSAYGLELLLLRPHSESLVNKSLKEKKSSFNMLVMLERHQ